ncbi:MAG: M42 family metallopeptidase [Clostridia bacterium]|nr:M42 family metallopeptidase [Clostridia bacterium]
MLRTLKKLCLLNGVSGSEEEVREYIKYQARKYTDDIKTDPMGNLIVVKHAGNCCAADRLPKLMIAAHMDEVGFMVCDITSEGYLKFEPVGGIDPRVVFNRRVWVGANRIPGVTGLKAIHQTPEEQRSEIPGWTSMYIDIGARTREEAAALVEIGDPIAFFSDFTRFGKGRGFIKAKAIDDRFGCAVMLKLLEKDLPMDVTFVFTVQEELGTRGATAAAYTVAPDIALILEGTTSADLAGVEGHKKVTVLGDGPVLGFMDAGTIFDRKLFEGLRGLATENKLRWQIKGRIAGGTDAQAVQRSREGARVASISAPVRSIHCPNSVAKVSDIEQCLKLAELFIDAVASGRIK